MTGSPEESAKAEGRRGAERLEILGKLRGEVMVFAPMAIREISATGAQVETAFPLHLNSLHDFRLALGDVSVVLKARVVHCRVADVIHDTLTYRSGVEFVALDARLHAAIDSFCAAIRDGRRAP
jgi:hypothetical protein